MTENGAKEKVEIWRKQNIAEHYKSLIKCALYEKHGIDITNPFKYPNMKSIWDSILEQITLTTYTSTGKHIVLKVNNEKTLMDSCYNQVYALKYTTHLRTMTRI